MNKLNSIYKVVENPPGVMRCAKRRDAIKRRTNLVDKLSLLKAIMIEHAIKNEVKS